MSSAHKIVTQTFTVTTQQERRFVTKTGMVLTVIHIACQKMILKGITIVMKKVGVRLAIRVGMA